MIANKTLLQRKYARIVKLFAENNSLSYEEALNLFYNSKTFELISNGIPQGFYSRIGSIFCFSLV